jgi:hypothetical protein
VIDQADDAEMRTRARVTLSRNAFELPLTARGSEGRRINYKLTHWPESQGVIVR